MKEQKQKKPKHVFIVFDKKDPLELPLIVADNMQEIAEFLKTKRDSCYKALHYGQAIRSRFLVEKVYLD